MSRKWVEREAKTGGSVEPDAVNIPIRTQQSSITTIDRDQLPDNFVDDTRLAGQAVYQTYVAPRDPASGEQNLQSTAVTVNAFESLTASNDPSGWYNFDGGSSPLTDFKGGSLFLEWSGNAFAYPAFAWTTNTVAPWNPKYLNLRILVNGVVFTERRGVAYMEHFRIFGTKVLPAGDLSVEFQYRMTTVGCDDPLVSAIPAGDIMQAHLFSSKWFARAVWR